MTSYLDTAVKNFLHSKVSSVVLLPAEGVEVVALLAPVPEPQVVAIDLEQGFPSRGCVTEFKVLLVCAWLLQ